MFGRKGLAGSAAAAWLTRPVVVRAGSLDPDADDYALPGDLVAYVNHALHGAFFDRDELAAEAMWAFHVDYYLAQVCNGGHGQFAHNSGWTDFVRNDIRRGLAAIGLAEASAIFASLETFALAEPARFASVQAGAGFGTIDPFIDALDKRFFAISNALRAGLRRWMSGWPSLMPLDPERYEATMAGLIDANPHAARRRAERAEASERDQRADPVREALRFICHVTPPVYRFESWLSASPVTSGVPGTVFRVMTDRGVAEIFMSEGIARFIAAGQTSILSKVPSAMIDAYLARQGLSLPPEIRRGEAA